MAERRTAGVWISRVRLFRFRCLDDVTIDLGRSATFLVGENNAGKSSILLGLETVLGGRRPIYDDLQRGEEGAVLGDACIDVYLSPAADEGFENTLTQELQLVQRDPATGKEIVGIRTTLRSSEEGHFLSADRRFLQLDQRGDWVEAPSPTVNARALQVVDAQLLHASRDLVGELGNRTSNWGRVLSGLGIPDEVAEGESGSSRAELERQLATLAAELRESSPVLKSLDEDLQGLADAQPSVGKVELQPLPPSLEEIARAAEVVLQPPGAPVLPMRFHGMGSRSLAALLVFKTLCSVRVGADRGTRPHMLTMLEEPEAHLHPQAVASLRSLIDELPGQCLVSTHSPQLVAEVDPAALRLLRQDGGSVSVRSLSLKTAKKIAQFRRFVERPFGEILFARLVVFGDGTTERNTLPVLLQPSIGCDPAGLGITFIDTEGMDQPEKMNKVLEALGDLGIPWLLFVDNDDSGSRALANVNDPKTGLPLDRTSPRVVGSGRKQIETLLLDAGFHEQIEAVAESAGHDPAEDLDHLKFLKSNKSWAAELVAREAVRANRPMPSEIVRLGERIMEVLGTGKAATQDKSVDE